MRIVVQRVKRASVTGNMEWVLNWSILQSFKVSDALVGSIDAGLCLLVGLTHEDTEKDLEEL